MKKLRRRLRRSLLLAPLFLIAASAEHKHEFEFTPENLARLRSGQVVVEDYVFTGPAGEKMLSFIATALVKAPPEEVWRTVRDYDRFHEFMPRLSEARVLKREDECAFIRYQAGVLWIEVVYHIKACATRPGERIDFELAPEYENSIKATYGFWQITSIAEGRAAVVSYSAYLDPGIPVPDAVSRSFARSNIVQVLENVRKRAESKGTWKKK